jgi:hypothetical protein
VSLVGVAEKVSFLDGYVFMKLVFTGMIEIQKELLPLRRLHESPFGIGIFPCPSRNDKSGKTRSPI